MLGLPDGVTACLFDLDGVLTDTAKVHAKAWKQMFDGVVAEHDHLAGKPAPDTFLAASRALGVGPDQAVVFEDALSGVAAGRAGNFAFVVGVDRVGHADGLRANGASVVVTDLAQLLDNQGRSGPQSG